MARRSKSSFFEDLTELASLLPWKIGIAIAVVSYLGLHYVASMTIVATTDVSQMGANTGKQIYITMALFMQYIIPIAFLVGAGLSAYKRRHRSQLLDKQSGIESIRAMSWQSFELLVGEAFRRQGYTVEERGGNGPDGGVDLVLYKSGKKAVVQCKRWKSYSINVSLVRELFGVMVAEAASECIFVTCGTFTLDAVEFAKSKAIQLIDGEKLVTLTFQVQRGGSGIRGPSESDVEAIDSAPDCPQCGSPMVRRVAKKGAHAGQSFWGCTNYPRCRGTI